jgi:hypothetical protein
MRNIQIRERYYEQRFGTMHDQVAHSTDEKPVHIDIYAIKPNAECAYWTLVTSGMSDMPMAIPAPMKGFAAPRVELIMYTYCPKPWMFKTLKAIAEFASRRKTYLHWHHTWTPNGILTDTAPQLTSCLFLPPYLEDTSMNDLRIDGDRVEFLWVVPITERERSHAVQNGSEVLERLLMMSGLDLIDYEVRNSVV